ncbi:MAG: hypothetical protein LBJ88_01225 [Campylobacteraceae bacterium]|nr:hypothetical protein [Campylobacteraceae bacterium]
MHQTVWKIGRYIADIKVLFKNLSQKVLSNTAMNCLERNLHLQGKRNYPILEKYDSKDIYFYMCNVLWGIDNHNNKIITQYSLKELENSDILINGGESFDDYFCYILESLSYDWIIWGE